MKFRKTSAIAEFRAREDEQMERERVIKLLDSHRDRLDDFAVKALFLFGSVARDEATSKSDVDVLVEFKHPVGLFTLLGLQAYLEELLGCSVDVGTPSSLRPHLRETVLKEAIRAV
ncbi:nucleotidyltransferase family protein [Baaleninema simplex]|uniref:nucleotidyltransferase family protein n=1 Tax=Baaleninema simplex TaxID=2862350 RepID=UPI00034DA42A